jgi:hypothetical protein
LDAGRWALAEPIKVFVFALLLLGAHKTSVGYVTFMFLALLLPICWLKSQPRHERLLTQPKPQDEVSDEAKGDTNEKPRNEPEKADNKRLKNVVCVFLN